MNSISIHILIDNFRGMSGATAASIKASAKERSCTNRFILRSIRSTRVSG